MTTWLDVIGFEGFYEVSDSGRVRSKERLVSAINRWGQLRERKYPAKELKAYVNKQRGGYRYVNLNCNGQHMRRIAVLVAEAFIGARPEGMVVCHCNGIPTDDRALNLRYDTPKANSADQLAHGTRLRGSRHPQARLTDEQISEIRRLHNIVPKAELARRFGVHAGHISNIQNGWRRAA